MSLFEKDLQFYPTPETLLDRMRINCEDKNVGEFHAGDGRIADYVRLRGAKELYIAEIDKGLQNVLRGKGYFINKEGAFDITSQDVSHLNLIVINPPFRNGWDHFLHAWDIAPAGCEIICLLNAKHFKDTIRYHDKESYGFLKKEGGLSKKGLAIKRVEEIVEEHGFKEFYEPEEAFDSEDAYRRTPVEIVEIHVYKPLPDAGEEDEGFYFDANESDFPADIATDVMTYSELDAIIGSVRRSVDLYKTVSTVANDMKYMLDSVGIYLGELEIKSGKGYGTISIRQFRRALYRKAWDKIFTLMKLDNVFTGETLKRLEELAERQKNFPFTKSNVLKVVEFIYNARHSLMQKSIVSTIDTFLSLSWRENPDWGWKTNRENILNTTFILPNIGNGYETNYYYNSNNLSLIEDLMKMIYALKGHSYQQKG